jgi:hypothetical protein
MSLKAALVLHLYQTYGTDIQESAYTYALSMRDVYQLNAYLSDLRLTTVRQRATV